MGLRNKKRMQTLSLSDRREGVTVRQIFPLYKQEYPESKLAERQFCYILRAYFLGGLEKIFEGYGIKATHGRVFQVMRIKRKPRKRPPMDYAASAKYKRDVFGCDTCESFMQTKKKIGRCLEVEHNISILQIMKCPKGNSDVIFKRRFVEEEGIEGIVRDNGLYKIAFVQREENIRKLKYGRSYDFIPSIPNQERIRTITDREQYEIKQYGNR